MALVPELPTFAQPQLKVDRKILIIDKAICRYYSPFNCSSCNQFSLPLSPLEYLMFKDYFCVNNSPCFYSLSMYPAFAYTALSAPRLDSNPEQPCKEHHRPRYIQKSVPT